MDIIALEKKRLEWSLKTFTEATPSGSLEKAKEEIKEIEEDIANDINNPVEYADAIMCIFDVAGRRGISAKEVMKAYEEKIEINTNRTWTKNPDNSYSHVKA
jgi:hypothetical protein